MLTHIIQSSHVSLFLIDEPDIYLHSDLQRQLMGLLRTLGPDILIATHSTEIVSDVDAEDILVINKKNSRPGKIKNPDQLEELFKTLGSNVNPVLTQLSKTRRVVFVEGKDFQIISRFAKKVGYPEVAGRSKFAVVSVDGFNTDRAKNLKKGMEATLGLKVEAAVILDRDYRSSSQVRSILDSLKDFVGFSVIHRAKEIENFLLVPSAIDRAVTARLRDRKLRTGEDAAYIDSAQEILEDFSDQKKHYVSGQYAGLRRQFERERGSKLKDETIFEEELKAFDSRWKDPADRLAMIPGKEALSFLNGVIQKKFGVTVTATAIIDAMRAEEVPEEIMDLIASLDQFSKKN